MRSHGEVRQINGKRVASPEYRAWQAMRNRCRNSNCKDNRRYAHKGIDPRWERFEDFLADMGRRPTPKHTLERKKNHLGYSKANCEWATREVQARNRGAYIKHSKVIADQVRALYATGKYRQVDIAAMFPNMKQIDVSQMVRMIRWK